MPFTVINVSETFVTKCYNKGKVYLQQLKHFVNDVSNLIVKYNGKTYNSIQIPSEVEFVPNKMMTIMVYMLRKVKRKYTEHEDVIPSHIFSFEPKKNSFVYGKFITYRIGTLSKSSNSSNQQYNGNKYVVHLSPTYKLNVDFTRASGDPLNYENIGFKFENNMKVYPKNQLELINTTQETYVIDVGNNKKITYVSDVDNNLRRI